MIRFAILAGVSTDAQATPEKLSIPDQLSHCREKLAGQGIETAGPFIMDGYSRSGYDSLEVACKEIPPLGAAIRSATDDQYDVLIMDNFDRLGDLGFIVKTRFKKLRKQLYSVRQSGRLTEPALYDPYASESDDIAMYVEGILQTYRINKIRRGWNIGVPERARQGLHPLSLPFGYKLAAKGEPAQQIPEQIELIRQIKDWFLAGQPFQEIADRANLTGIQPRRASAWSLHAIQRILQNRFYAGVTTFGKLKTIQGKRIPVPPSQWVSAPGKHEPAYDLDTYLEILNELDRRSNRRSRSQTYALSGLLSCSICGQRLHRHGPRKYPVYLNCRRGKVHVQIEYALALQLIAQKVTSALSNYQDAPPTTDPTGSIPDQLHTLEDARARVHEGYEAHIYTQAEAARRIVAIETEMGKLTTQQGRAAQQTHQRQQLLALAREDLTKLTDWIIHDDPTTVNHLLTALCDTITITPMYDLNIVWR